MNRLFDNADKRAIEARFDAQRITFGPIIFQAVYLLRKLGIMEAIDAAGETGAGEDDISTTTGVSRYGVRVLLETGLSAGILTLQNKHYFLTTTGHFILHDELTRVNMDFVQDVCYQGMFYLEQAISTGKPSGIKVFGEWDTLYRALSSLPDNVQSSWFRFDHYYSNIAFKTVLPIVFNDVPPRSLLDIGGNTGNWAIECARYDKDVTITILDLPGQLEKASSEIRRQNLTNRINLRPMDLLDHTQPFPKNFDVIWMSQLLVCFSEDDVKHLLKRAASALNKSSCLYILDTYWDKQQYEIAAYCLINTSPYFTCMANGNSRMYRSDEILAFIEKAGLNIVEETDSIGLGHTLLKCKRAKG